MVKKLKYLSLFSGIGGFEYGLEQSKYDFESVGFSEVDSYAKAIYTRWFPRHKDLGDASEIDPREIDDFELLVGGFPCQAFSLAGKRKGFDDTRGTLFFEIARICKEKKPRYLLLENVKGLLSHDKGRTFKKILGVLSELGYDVEWQVLNSKSFGVAQNRERVYIKGYFRAKCGGEILSHRRENEETGDGLSHPIKVGNFSDTNHNGANVYSEDGISPTICSEAIVKNGVHIQTEEPKLKPFKFERQVKKRIHSVNQMELCEFLREHKKAALATVTDISEKLGVPKSEVEHWFRKDQYFAPPSDEVWHQLKELLDITDEKYDAYITEFEWVDGVYDTDKRAYETDGLSPTLDTKKESALIKVAGNLSDTGHMGDDVFDVEGVSRTLNATNYKHPLMILEKNDDIIVEKVFNTNRDFNQSVTDGTYVPCLTQSMGTGGNNVPMLKLRTNTEKGYDEVTIGDGVRICHPTSTKARGRTQKEQVGSLSTGADWGTVDNDFRIRRLTPLECERLQAFPDGWTEYGADGKKISDTQRYKTLGNAVTTSVITYIADNMFGGYFES